MSKVDAGEQHRAEFLRLAGAAYDQMLKEDQEGLVTFTQLEDRALEVGQKLEAWLLKQSLRQKAQAGGVGATPRCPKCGKVLLEASSESGEREVQTRAGPVVFQRLQYSCPSCRKVFSPLDAALGLSGEGYSPALLQKVVSQGGRYAFGEAAHNLRELAGVAISGQHVLRLTERLGKEWVARRDQELADFEQGRLPRLYAARPAAAVVMLDGGRVQTRAEPSPPGVREPAWQEPKYGCLLTIEHREHSEDPQPDPPAKFLDRTEVPRLVQQLQRVRAAAQARSADGQVKARGAHAGAERRKRRKRWLVRTVVATMAGVKEFGQQLALEVYKRGLDLARRKGCLADGQASNWTVFEEHLRRRGFIAILDFLHLLTYLYAAAQAVGGTAAQRWQRYKQWLTWAWRGVRDKLLVALQKAGARLGEAPPQAAETDARRIVAKAAQYVLNNIEKMDYPRYRKMGLPISSAPVESLIKQFNKRIKGSEKFWRRSALEAVLQVRAAQLSQDGREERLWAMPRPLRAPHRKILERAA